MCNTWFFIISISFTDLRNQFNDNILDMFKFGVLDITYNYYL